MNSRRKGLRIQRKAKKYLEEKGFKTYFIHHTRYSKDVWGLFDGLCLHILLNKVVFFQVKANKLPSLKPFKAFKKRFPYVDVWVMCWKDRKGWDIRKF